MFRIVNKPKEFATDLYGYEYFDEVMYKVDDGIEEYKTDVNFSVAKFWQNLLAYFDDPKAQNMDNTSSQNFFKKASNRYIFKYNYHAYELTTRPGTMLTIKRIPKENEYAELSISYFKYM